MTAGLFAYTITWVLVCIIAKFEYDKPVRCRIKGISSNRNINISIFAIFLISLIFSIYNYYVTVNSVAMAADRQNYLINFLGYRASPSLGLTFVMDVIHLFGGSINVLFCATTFISVFVTMVAYRISLDATPYSIYLLCLTQYFLTTLTALKQSFTNAFAVLFFVLAIEIESKRNKVWEIICIVIACLFHPSGFVLIPLCFLLQGNKSKKNISLYFFTLVIAAFLFEPLVILLGRMINPILPGFGSSLMNYFGQTEASQGFSLSLFKSVPYFFITILGLIKRKKLIKIIDNYDKYLIVVMTGSLLLLMGIYNVWLSRFSYLFAFTAFVFFRKIIEKERLRDNKMIYSAVMQLIFVFLTYRFLYIVYATGGGF